MRYYIKRKIAGKLLPLILIAALFSVLLTEQALCLSRSGTYRRMDAEDAWYRREFFSPEMAEAEGDLSEECASLFRNVKREIQYFPVAVSSLDASLDTSFVDTWQAERTFGGERGHEGTDIMADVNQRGVYPVLSVCDGTVTNLGWLEKGGYRIGITSDSGTYFYYAHLDSYANIKEGDRVLAGEFLGYMGDSGYGEEGTVGKFDVHLHFGIYFYTEGKEISVNPYYVLKELEKDTLAYEF